MNQLIQTVFNDEITEAGLDELKAKYPANVVMDMTIDANFKQGRKIRTERNKLVDAINRKRLDVTAELKGKGDTLINEVNGIYDPLITAFELEDKRQKDEAKRIQEELEAVLNAERKRIMTIGQMVHSCRGASSAHISDTIEAIDLIETDVFHKDIIHEAIEAKKQALSALTEMLTDAVSREKIDAEREIIRKEREEMEAQRAEFEKQKAELATMKAEAEAAQKAEADRIELEKQATIKNAGHANNGSSDLTTKPSQATEALREMQSSYSESECNYERDVMESQRKQYAPTFTKSDSVAVNDANRTPLTAIQQAYKDGFEDGANFKGIHSEDIFHAKALQYPERKAA